MTHSVNPHLMAEHLANETAAVIRKFAEQDTPSPPMDGTYFRGVPSECQPGYLIGLCEKVAKIAQEEHCCVTKIHRLVAYVHGVMVALCICTIDDIRKLVRDAKSHYAEAPDRDLEDHQNEESPFFLDIGGEGGG